MKILVTGAAGFLGYHTAVALAGQPHELILADNFGRHGHDDAFAGMLRARQLTFHEVDLLDGANWRHLGEGYDAVVHFAAINGTRYFYDRPYEVLERNIELVRLLLEWHRARSPAARIIWTSSAEVYAGMRGLEIPTPETTGVGVDDVFNPRYSYAVSKMAGELMLINYARARNTMYTIIRPHNIYGPRMGVDHVVPAFCVRARERQEPFLIHGGDETRAFCYVDNFVNGLRAILASRDADGHIINLGDDREEIRVRDLAQRLFDIAGWRPKRIEVRPAPPGSAARRRPSIDKARRLLRYEPTVGLDEGLRRTYLWYANH